MRTYGTRPRFAPIIITLICATLGVAACTPAASAPGDLAPERIVTNKCTKCHTDTKVLAWRSTSKAAAATMIDGMVGKGAQLTSKERAILIDYFVRP